MLKQPQSDLSAAVVCTELEVGGGTAELRIKLVLGPLQVANRHS